MSDLLSYELWHSRDRYGYYCDDEGDLMPIEPDGWYYQFPESEPVGPFTTSGSAEFCAEAELEELLYAN